MIMMMILIGVVTGMMQCAKKSMAHKHPAPPAEGLAPGAPLHLAGRG